MHLIIVNTFPVLLRNHVLSFVSLCGPIVLCSYIDVT